MRTLIIGAPRCGKTTEAGKLFMQQPEVYHKVICIDELIKDYEWSELSDKLCGLLQQPGDWIIEGCSGVRGLRKYLRLGLVPDFDIIYLGEPKAEQTPKQIGFGAQCASIWRECQDLMVQNTTSKGVKTTTTGNILPHREVK